MGWAARSRRGLATAVVLTCLAAVLASTPSGRADEPAPPPNTEVPSSAVATPTEVLSGAVGVPDTGIAATSPDWPFDDAPIAQQTTPAGFVQDVAWHHDASRFVLLTTEFLTTYSADGDMLGQVPVALGAGPELVLADTLIVFGGTQIVEYDPVTLAEVAAFTMPERVFSVAAIGDELIVPGAGDGIGGPITRVDRSDGSTTTEIIAFPQDFQTAAGLLYDESLGTTIVVPRDGGGYFLIDTSVSPAAITTTVTTGRPALVGRDGTLFVRPAGAPANTLEQRTIPDGTLLSTTRGIDWHLQYLDAPELIVTRDGSDVAIVPLGGSAPAVRVYTPTGLSGLAANPDATRILGAGSTIDFLSPGPRPTSADQQLFRPAYYDQITISGNRLVQMTEVTVNGRSVPFTSNGSTAITLDVSEFAPTFDLDAVVRLTTRWGSSSFVVPGTAPRGWTEVTIRARGSSTSSVDDYLVACAAGGGNWNTRRTPIRSGSMAVLLVPTLLSCEARALTNRSQTSGGLWVPGRSAPAHVYGRNVPFFSDRTTHADFLIDPDTPRSFWLFTFPTGDPPSDVRYPFVITCGRWTKRQQVRAGFGVKIELPDRAEDRCTVRLSRSKGAESVESFIVGTDELHGSGDREITVGATIRQRDRYVAFVMDHGGSDFTAPIAVASTGEDLGRRKDAGIVHVFRTDGAGSPTGAGSQLLRQGRRGLGDAAGRGDQFGEAVEFGDFNGDGFTDLAIGVPHEDTPAGRNVGIVHVVYGTANGFYGGGRQILAQGARGTPGSGEPQDRFGAALAAIDFNGDGWTDLAVGTPGDRGANGRRGGTVQVFLGGRGGLDPGAVEHVEQGQGSLNDAPADGDDFGLALDAYRGLLAIGAPASGDTEGVVHVVYGPTGASQRIRQGGRNSETGNEFGTAVVLGPDFLAIGIPGEDRGTRQDVGEVHLMTVTVRPRVEGFLFVEPRRDILRRERLDRVRGDAGDRLGASLAWLPGPGSGLVAIGAPGVNDTGRVFLTVGARGGLWNLFDQDSDGVPTTAVAGERFGQAVATGPVGTLMVSAPGETVGPDANAGRVFFTADGQTWTSITQDTRGVKSPAQGGDRFGSTLAG